MRPALTFSLLIGLAVMLCSCPYESYVPLDETASSYINTDLLGTWRYENYPNDSTEVSFYKKSDYEYYVEAKLPYQNTYSHYSFTGYFCHVKDGVLLNLKEESGANYVAAIWLNSKHLTIKALSENITDKQFSTSSEFKAFIEKIYSNSTVKYDDETALNDLQKVE